MIDTSYCVEPIYSISEDLYERKIKRLKRKHASFTQSTVLFQFPCFHVPVQTEDEDNNSPLTPNSHSDHSEQEQPDTSPRGHAVDKKENSDNEDLECGTPPVRRRFDKNSRGRPNASFHCEASDELVIPDYLRNKPVSKKFINCFFYPCTYVYQRPGSRVFERTDRILPLGEKFGENIRSCKQHSRVWMNKESAPGQCEICKDMNKPNNINLFKSYVDPNSAYRLCDICARRQQNMLKLVIDDAKLTS